MEAFNAFLSAGIGAGFMAIVNNIITHKMKKNDKEDERMAALTEAQKLLMQDKVRYLGGEIHRRREDFPGKQRGAERDAQGVSGFGRQWASRYRHGGSG